MKLFITFVKTLMENGAEVWGWKGKEDLEKIQMKCMKWILKLDKTTPGHILHMKIKRFKLETKTKKGAMKYEGKLRKAEKGTQWTECW